MSEEIAPKGEDENLYTDTLLRMGGMMRRVGSVATILHFQKEGKLPNGTVFGLVLMLDRQQQVVGAYPDEPELPMLPAQDRATSSVEGQLSEQLSN